jgi:hypothetical protein
MPTRAQAAGGRSSPSASGRPRGAPDAVRAAPSGQPSPRPAPATPRVTGTMRRRLRAAFRVYDEDEFFAAPAERWLCEASAPAARPRFRFLAAGVLLAGAIFSVGSAVALERLPSSGGSRGGAMFGTDGSGTRYLAARSVPIRTRSARSTPRGNSSLLPPRAPRPRTGAVAKGRFRMPRTRGGAVRGRTAASARSVTTPAGSTAAPVSAAGPVPAAAPAPPPAAVPVPAPVLGAGPVPAGEGPASVARRATPERAAGAGTAADGRPVVSASGGVDRRERPEFGFER